MNLDRVGSFFNDYFLDMDEHGKVRNIITTIIRRIIQILQNHALSVQK